VPLTKEELLCAELIERRAVLWPDHIENLRIPFPGISPPGVQSLYGSAGSPSNTDRIDRFFAHEFTHLLHREWRKIKQPTIESPLEQALWACLTEGLGNYRSLSARWTDVQGDLSPHAKEVLSRLQSVLVDRLSALEHASADEADSLMQGLSMGSFEEKWGALPVALWLALEAKDDDRALQKWVESGPWGIVDLATKHLPKDLANRLPERPK
jgi:hypothetical protein